MNGITILQKLIKCDVVCVIFEKNAISSCRRELTKSYTWTNCYHCKEFTNLWLDFDKF